MNSIKFLKIFTLIVIATCLTSLFITIDSNPLMDPNYSESSNTSRFSLNPFKYEPVAPPTEIEPPRSTFAQAGPIVASSRPSVPNTPQPVQPKPQEPIKEDPPIKVPDVIPSYPLPIPEVPNPLPPINPPPVTQPPTVPNGGIGNSGPQDEIEKESNSSKSDSKNNSKQSEKKEGKQTSEDGGVPRPDSIINQEPSLVLAVDKIIDETLSTTQIIEDVQSDIPIPNILETENTSQLPSIILSATQSIENINYS